jgi:hypothetical protein
MRHNLLLLNRFNKNTPLPRRSKTNQVSEPLAAIAKGDYTVPFLTPGEYEITAEPPTSHPVGQPILAGSRPAISQLLRGAKAAWKGGCWARLPAQR